MDIRPMPGAQTKFLMNQADICVFGGSAGSSKSYSLLLEAMRHVDNPGYGAVIFRRQSKQILSEGGLRDTAMTIYPNMGATYRSQPTPQFIFPSGARITFAHLNEETECLNWQGSQIAMIGFDEATHFTEWQVDYMMSRNRSTCGVRPLVRLTCNPDADSWLAEMLSWWIDQETGYPIQERSGVLRYMIRADGHRIWGDTREELVCKYGCDINDPKSFSFVPAKITDNPILLKKDPGYLANLKGLSRVEKARLLDGNWLVRAQAGDYFPRGDVEIIDWIPNDVVKWVRSWDLAATEEGESRDPDYTVGILMGRRSSGKIVIADVVKVRRKANDVQSMIRNLALKDGKEIWIVLPQDPGAAGKAEKESYIRLLNGYTVITRTINKNKVIMASSGADSPAALWQRGQVEIVRANWNKDFLDECDAFPTKGVHDDQIDALSSGIRNLPGHAKPNYSQSGLNGRFKEVRSKRQIR